MKRWRLCLDECNGNGRFVTVGFEPTFIGRGPDCGLQLNHPLVSRRHCMLNTDGDRLFVRDAGSKHGTFVNGHRADRDIELHSGDTLWIGVYPIIVESLAIENRPAGDRRAYDPHDDRPCLRH